MARITKEYEEIREALLSLLCVGDTINYIHSHRDGMDTQFKPYNTILKYRIVEVFEKAIRIENFGYISTVLRPTIEQYKGELYIWNNANSHAYTDREKRIEELIKVIESDLTRKVIVQ
jgi:hypothetical protein